MESFKKENISVWYSNWSTEHSTAKKNLKRLFHTDIEVTQALSADILKFDESPWSVTRDVIWFLEGKLSKSQITGLYEIINDHFHHIIRPDKLSKEKYAWLCEDGKNSTEDVCIIDFLIWLLNHPFQSLKKKTADALVQLATYLGEDVVVCLIKAAISEIPELSTASCSFVLNTISKKNPELVATVLSNRTDLINGMAAVKHFTIKYNFISMADNLDTSGFEHLKIAMDKTIPEKVLDSGEVFLEDPILSSIDYEIAQLNDIGLLDKRFCKELISKIEEYCAPLTPMELLKSDKYLKRSFYNETEFQGRQVEILTYALNRAISDNVDKSRMERVYKILNDV